MFVLLALGAIVIACANTGSYVRKHPEEVKGLVNCSECHSDRWGALNHKASDFFLKHKFYARQQKLACGACHQESFCTDCHAYREELKPSDRYVSSPERTLPHRGDYLGQHRIDGMINPASCVKCHGRQNNERCKTCHR